MPHRTQVLVRFPPKLPPGSAQISCCSGCYCFREISFYWKPSHFHYATLTWSRFFQPWSHQMFSFPSYVYFVTYRKRNLFGSGCLSLAMGLADCCVLSRKVQSWKRCHYELSSSAATLVWSMMFSWPPQHLSVSWDSD